MKICWQFLFYRIRGIKFYFPISFVGDVYKSQFGQDKIIEELFSIKPNGFFVEIGSNHPVDCSNSYYFEHTLGFTGISIDAIDYSALYATFRPNTKFINTLIDVDIGERDFYVAESSSGWESMVSSVSSSIKQHGRGFVVNKFKVKTRPLSDICLGVESIDIMMLDVEGHEMEVLSSFDWSLCRPKYILSENTGEYFPRSDLEGFMRKKGYKLVARIGTSDDVYIDSLCGLRI
jgi:hypothetical protein